MAMKRKLQKLEDVEDKSPKKAKTDELAKTQEIAVDAVVKETNKEPSSMPSPIAEPEKEKWAEKKKEVRKATTPDAMFPPIPGASLYVTKSGQNMGRRYWAIYDGDGNSTYFRWVDDEGFIGLHEVISKLATKVEKFGHNLTQLFELFHDAEKKGQKSETKIGE